MMPGNGDIVAPLERLFSILLTASIAGGVVILATAALGRTSGPARVAGRVVREQQ